MALRQTSVRGWLRRRHEVDDRWNAYLRQVEPALAATVRVRRFARVPLQAPATTPSAALAVLVEQGPPDAIARTVGSLSQSTVAPAEVLQGDPESALSSCRFKWVVLVRAGDELAPLALERLGQAATLSGDAAVITCDDDRMTAFGRAEPQFRPGPSPDRWLAVDDSGPLLAVRRAPAASAYAELDRRPWWRHELALLLAGEDGERHAHVPLLLCHRGNDSPPPPVPVEALRQVLATWGRSVPVEEGPRGRRVRWPVNGEPLVEVIVCLRDRPDLLERCANALLSRTAYERWSLTLVDNGSSDPRTLALLGRLGARSRARGS